MLYCSFLVESWGSGHGYDSMSQKVAAVPTATHHWDCALAVIGLVSDPKTGWKRKSELD